MQHLPLTTWAQNVAVVTPTDHQAQGQMFTLHVERDITTKDLIPNSREADHWRCSEDDLQLVVVTELTPAIETMPYKMFML